MTVYSGSYLTRLGQSLIPHLGILPALKIYLITDLNLNFCLLHGTPNSGRF